MILWKFNYWTEFVNKYFETARTPKNFLLRMHKFTEGIVYDLYTISRYNQKLNLRL